MSSVACFSFGSDHNLFEFDVQDTFAFGNGYSAIDPMIGGDNCDPMMPVITRMDSITQVSQSLNTPSSSPNIAMTSQNTNDLESPSSDIFDQLLDMEDVQSCAPLTTNKTIEHHPKLASSLSPPLVSISLLPKDSPSFRKSSRIHVAGKKVPPAPRATKIMPVKNIGAGRKRRLPVTSDEEDVSDSDESGSTYTSSNCKQAPVSRQAEYARNYRQKNKQFMNTLENTIVDLTGQNKRLRRDKDAQKGQISVLHKEIEYLKGVLANDSALATLINRVAPNTAISLKTSPMPNDNVRGTPGVCLHVREGNVSVELCGSCNSRSSINRLRLVLQHPKVEEVVHESYRIFPGERRS